MKTSYIRIRCTEEIKAQAVKNSLHRSKTEQTDLTEYITNLIIEDTKEINRKGNNMKGNTEKYFINYNTNMGNGCEKSLKTAMKIAEEECAYTQKDINIEYNGKIVATLPWYGIAPSDDDIVTVQYGSFGFYGEWDINEIS